MKLRAKLGLILGLSSIVLLLLLGWVQTRFERTVMLGALAEATVDRMESGGRERCEANPEGWPRSFDGHGRGPRRHHGPGPRPPRLSAYDSSFQSKNPQSPPFPKDLAARLNSGEDMAIARGASRRRALIALRMPWNEGPCAVVLARARSPLPWFSAAVLLPALLVSLGVVLISLLAAGPIVRRIRQLTGAVEEIERGANVSIATNGKDEIADLGRAFEKSRTTIQEQIRSLEEREAALRNYIANTTHDVMLPLSVLQGHLASLQRRIETGEQLDSTALVPSLEESQYLGSLLHNLNAAARLEAHENLAHRDPIDLGRLVERVVDRHRPIARRKEIAINVAVPEQPIEFAGDLTLLEQALGNVVQNAIRYHDPNGHVAVILEGDADAWDLQVIDDGRGIPEEERARVLEPSFRGTDARTRHPHGMGLGLHIASDVAARHGLGLSLSDTEGGGLTVSFQHRANRERDT